MSRNENLNKYIGQKFGNWLVIDIGEEKTFSWRNRICKRKMLKCKCECGYCNGIIKDIDIGNLKGNKTKSCGTKRGIRKINTYEIVENYVIGYTAKNEKFYFDLEDFDKVKQYSWHKGNNGYIKTRSYGKFICLHNLVFYKKNPDNDIDHINKDKIDNRKINLRECTRIENSNNINIPINNTSGYIGVGYDKFNNKWMAQIVVNYKEKFLGRFKNKEDAIIARLKAEKELLGEFAPQKHLFKKYGIEEMNN